MNVIITGATGMVGEGVLHICLNHPDVESILVINRKTCGIKHHKLKEIIHKDFKYLAPIEDNLTGYNACFFCAGISSIGKREYDYKLITYDLTLGFAGTLVRLNPEMIFVYVSGVGTDSTEKGKSMWARVKGKTENDLLKLPFKSAYMFRPGIIKPIKGMKNTYSIYKIFNPLYPVVEKLFPNYANTLNEIGLAMINTARFNYDKKIVECSDIRKFAEIENKIIISAV
jgi:hypothetical protein